MVTIADVARHAGVAQSTVSYALTGKRSISAGTRSRVWESVRALGYRQRDVQTTARGRNVLGLVAPPGSGLTEPAEARFMMSAVVHASRQEMDVLLVTTGEGVRRSPEVDGFLVMDAGADLDVALRQIAKPCVFVGRPVPARRFPCIDLDFEAAGALCVDHLAGLGHRYIGFLGSPGGFYGRSTFAHRVMAGFTAAAMLRGIVTTAVPAEDDHESVLCSTTALLRAHPLMTALVVQNEAAVGSITGWLRVVERKRLRDTAVVAVCPDDLATAMSPPLTSVHLPVEELAELAVDLLIELAGGGVMRPWTPLSPRLSRRSSTTATSPATFVSK